MKKHELERQVLFDYLLMECDHKEAIVGETHWHVCHAGTGDSICVTNHKLEATVIAYGLALYDKLSVSEQLQILGESTSPATSGEKEERVSFEDFLKWLTTGAPKTDEELQVWLSQW